MVIMEAQNVSKWEDEDEDEDRNVNVNCKVHVLSDMIQDLDSVYAF